MRERVFSVLGLQRIDGRNLFQLGPIFFLAGLAYTGGIIPSQSLFISRLGVEYLPLMYFIEACILPFQLWGISTLSQRVPRGVLIHKLFVVILAVLSLCTLVLFTMIGFGREWVGFYPILFVSCSVLLRIMVPLMWMLGDGICQLQQAKRLYPVLGSIFILGVGVSGFVSKVLAAGFPGVGTELSFLYLVVLLLISYFHWRRLIKQHFLSVELKEEEETGSSMKEVIRSIWQTKLLRISLVGFILLMGLYYIIDYQFMLFSNQKYPSSDEFSQFFGLYILILQLVSLLVSLGANRLLKIGVGNTTFLMGILTVGILAFSGVLAASEHALTSFLLADLFIDILAFSLIPLITPILYKMMPPAQRAAAALLFSGAINAVGKLVSSVITGVHSSGIGSLLYLSVVSFTIALIYLAFAWQQRQNYLPTLLGSLKLHLIETKELASFHLGTFLSKTEAITIAKFLRNEDATKQWLGLELCAQLKQDELRQDLLPFLKDPDPRKRGLALRSLSEEGEGNLPQFLEALEDGDLEVRREGIRKLKAHQGHPTVLAVLQACLQDPSPQIRREGILALYPSKEQELDQQMERLLTRMLAGEQEEKIQAIEAIRSLRAERFAQKVLELFSVERMPRLRNAAVRCLGELGSTQAIPTFLDIYPEADQALRKSIEEGIKTIGLEAKRELIAGLERKELLNWKLCLESLAILDQDDSLEKELSQSVQEKCGRLLKILELSEQFPGLGMREQTNLYQQRLVELEQILLEAAWAVLARYRDTKLMEKIRNALQLSTGDRRDLAIEILLEVGRVNPLALDIVRILSKPIHQIQSDPQGEKGFLETIPQIKELFPDEWLNRFLGHMVSRMEDEPMEKMEGQGRIEERQVTPGQAQEKGVDSLVDLMVFLKKVSLFADLKVQELGLIANIAREETYPEDAILIQEGTKNQILYLIADGFVAISAELSAELHGTIGILGPYNSVGEDSIFIDNSSPVTAQVVMKEAKIVTIEGEEIKGLIRFYPEIAMAMLASTSGRLQKLQRMVIKMEQSET